MRRTLCHSGVFQYFDLQTCRYGIHFPMYWRAILYHRLIFIRSKRCLRVFQRLCGHCERWDCRVDMAPPSCRQHPTSPCVLSEMHQFLGETKSVQMELHTCTSTCTNTYAHNNRSPSRNTHLTVRLCLIIPFRISIDMGFLFAVWLWWWDIKLPAV